MKKLYILFLIFANCSFVYSQNAKDYYSLILKAENKIIHKDLDSALILYDSAFVKYDYPFVRDVYQAAFIASYDLDTNKMNFYIKHCISKGANLTNFNYFKKKHPHNLGLSQIYLNFENLHSKFVNSLNYQLIFPYLQIQIEQQLIHNKELHNPNEKDSLANLAQKYVTLIDSIDYPLEKEVGLGFFNSSSTEMRNEKPDLKYNGNILMQHLRLCNVFLIHYDIQKDSILHDRMTKGVNSLKVSNVFLANLYDLNRNENLDFCIGMSSPYYKSVKYKKSKKYYLTKEKIARINNTRDKLYLRHIDIEEKLLKELIFLESGQCLPIIKEKHIKKYGAVLIHFLLSESS